jgi:FtsH-binding integral membrane protein
MEEENFSGQQSLEIIESMINKAKNQFSENGYLYLLWGWWVFACSIIEFILLNVMHSEWHWIVWWSVILVLGYQFFYLRKKIGRQRVRTYTDEIIGFVWITFLILMILIVFLLGRINDPNKFALIDPAFLVLYGMPTFLSGIILKFKPLFIGGIGCWILSVISTFVPPEYHLLFLPVAMIIAWIIPGYMLRKKYKSQTA